MGHTVARMEGRLSTMQGDVASIKTHLLGSGSNNTTAALNAVVKVVIAVMIFSTFALVGYMAMPVNARHGETQIEASGQ